MEMGTGKTITAIHDMLDLYSENKINSVVIFGPKSVYRNWHTEITEYTDQEMRISTWDPSLKDAETKEDLTQILVKQDQGLFIFLMNIESISSKKGFLFFRKIYFQTR